MTLLNTDNQMSPMSVVYLPLRWVWRHLRPVSHPNHSSLGGSVPHIVGFYIYLHNYLNLISILWETLPTIQGHPFSSDDEDATFLQSSSDAEETDDDVASDEDDSLG